MDKDEAFVLHALWELRAELLSLLNEDAALGFNIPHDPRHIRESIAALLERGLIEAHEGAGAPIAPAAVLDMMQGIPTPLSNDAAWCMAGQNRGRCVLGLTEAGGAAWEALFRPRWDAYVGTDVWDIGGRDWHGFGAFNRPRLEAAVERLEAAANAIEGVTAHLEISPAAAGKVVYWKKTGGWRAILMDGSGAPLLNIEDYDISFGGHFHEAFDAEGNGFYENMRVTEEEVFGW